MDVTLRMGTGARESSVGRTKCKAAGHLDWQSYRVCMFSVLQPGRGQMYFATEWHVVKRRERSGSRLLGVDLTRSEGDVRWGVSCRHPFSGARAGGGSGPRAPAAASRPAEWTGQDAQTRTRSSGMMALSYVSFLGHWLLVFIIYN